MPPSTNELPQLAGCAAIGVYACIRKASLSHMPIDADKMRPRRRIYKVGIPMRASQTTNNSVTNTTLQGPIHPRFPLAGRKSAAGRPHIPRRAELPKQLPQRPASRTGPGTRRHPRRTLEPRDPPALASHPPCDSRKCRYPPLHPSSSRPSTRLPSRPPSANLKPPGRSMPS